MRCLSAEFKRSEKTPKIIEDKINEILEQGVFKFANQCDSPSGRLVLLFWLEDGEGKTKAKVFRDQSKIKLQDSINTFLETGVKVRHTTMTVSHQSSNIFATVFYE